jgi:predicted transcriptional regulator of viral defense system
MNTGPDYDRLYEIAESQAGYFRAAQARQAGFSWERLSDNVKTGRFQRVSRGVYRLTHFPSSPFEDLFVAWLRTGSNSVISHESALSVYELSDVLPGEVHVIIPRTASRRRPGIRLHTNRLEPDEITMREGLPITTVARTIADVARSGMAEEHIRQAIQGALQRGLTTGEDLLLQAARHGGRAAQLILQTLKESSSEIQ